MGKKGIPGVSISYTQLLFQVMIKCINQFIEIIIDFLSKALSLWILNQFIGVGSLLSLFLNKFHQHSSSSFNFELSRLLSQISILSHFSYEFLLIYLTSLYILFWFREDLDHPNLQIPNVLIFHVFRYVHSRAVGRSENPGVPVVIRWA